MENIYLLSKKFWHLSKVLKNFFQQHDFNVEIKHLINHCNYLSINITCGQFDEGIVKDIYLIIVKQTLEVLEKVSHEK